MVCDNKKHLGQIYKLDTEAIGFDTIEECIDKCRYYEAHDAERRQIAAAGFERAIRDYTEVPIFARVVEIVEGMLASRDNRPARDAVAEKWNTTRFERSIDPIARKALGAARRGLNIARQVLRRSR